MNASPDRRETKHIVIIGGGPAGLMAAEQLALLSSSTQGSDQAKQPKLDIHIYEQKPSAARKFLMAGRGGLNLTHSENLDNFIERYGNAADFMKPIIQDFTPEDLRAWSSKTGQETFIGSSGRVFPQCFKASPLLRSWLQRLDSLGVSIHYRHQWQGWDNDGALCFKDAQKNVHHIKPDAAILALGGASWPKLGSDASWQDYLRARNVDITPFQAANCGFETAWSEIFKERYAGEPLKNIGASLVPTDTEAGLPFRQGEAMIDSRGIEGGLIYALSHAIREVINDKGEATLYLDLHTGLSHEELAARLSVPRKRDSFKDFLRKKAGLTGPAYGLLMEHPERSTLQKKSPKELTALIKSYPLRLTKPFPIDKAISSAGGIALDEVNEHLMLKKIPNLYVCGEMLDWEAPTGGYLLQACFATAVRAANGLWHGLSKA